MAKRVAEKDDLIGSLVGGKYRVQSQLAKGGMGSIYRCTQEPLGRTVALKVLSPGHTNYTRRQIDETRFFREATITSRLTHPHTVVIHDYGTLEAEAGFFLVMEFLDGHSLATVIERDAPMPPARALHILRQIVGSLKEAHAAGVVHRDVKPQNIILVHRAGDPDYVKVVDFGLVKTVGEADERVTEQGVVIGSPLYMSPEQIFDGPVDGRSDIYSLGVVAYELLAGRPPFVREAGSQGLGDIIRGHMSQPPPPFHEIRHDLDIPGDLEAAIRRCLAKKPEGRFPDADSLLEALDAVGKAGKGGRAGAAVNATAQLSRTAMAAAVGGATGGQVRPTDSYFERAESAAPTMETPIVRRRDGAPAAGDRADSTEPMTAGQAMDLAQRQSAAAQARHARRLWMGVAAALLTTAAATVAVVLAIHPGHGPARQPSAETRASAGTPASGSAVTQAAPAAWTHAGAAATDGPRSSAEGAAGTPAKEGAKPAEAAPAPEAAETTPARPATDTATDTSPSAGPPADTGGPTKTPAAVPVVATPPPAPVLTRLTLTSTPGGALVWDANRVLCETPCEATLPSARLPVSLRFSLKGHADATQIVPETAAGTALTVDAGFPTRTKATSKRRRPKRPKKGHLKHKKPKRSGDILMTR